jgi:hypothetical protein
MGHHLVGEGERARVHHVPHSQGSEERALLGAAGAAEHLGADPMRDGDRGQPDAAGGCVDQDALTRTQPSDLDERLLGRQEGDRDSRGVGGGEPGGHPHRECGVGDHGRREGAGRDSHHQVAGRDSGHARARGSHDTCALAAQRAGIARVHA